MSDFGNQPKAAHVLNINVKVEQHKKRFFGLSRLNLLSIKFPWILRPRLPHPEVAFAMAFFSMLLKNLSKAASRLALIVERLPSS